MPNTEKTNMEGASLRFSVFLIRVLLRDLFHVDVVCTSRMVSVVLAAAAKNDHASHSVALLAISPYGLIQ